jgi:hypothetical protein
MTSHFVHLTKNGGSIVGLPSGVHSSTDLAYRETARSIWERDGKIGIDGNARIDRGGGETGAWVQAWVWVNDDQLEPPAAPTYYAWICEPLEDCITWGDWRFTECFTSVDDDGKQARRSAHEYARYLRRRFHCAYVAVRAAEAGPPLDIRS